MFIIISALIIGAGVGFAQSLFTSLSNEGILLRDDPVYLNVRCADRSGDCLYVCPVCRKVYYALTKAGPLLSGPASCGCDSHAPSPGVN